MLPVLTDCLCIVLPREIKQYNYSHPQFGETTGHFTQLVWADTQQVRGGRGEGAAVGGCVAGLDLCMLAEEEEGQYSVGMV